MTIKLDYSTTAGIVTRGELYAQILEYLIKLQEACAMMGHLHNTEDSHMDKLVGKGWLGMAELMKRAQHQVTQLAMNKLQ